jgi:hypothetical protein
LWPLLPFETLQIVDKHIGTSFQQAQVVFCRGSSYLVTHAYFDRKLEKELAPIRTGQALQKWMAGVFY